MKKKATLAAAALLLTGAITAVYLKEREKPAAAHRVNITTRDPAGRQAAGEAEDSRSAAGRKRQPVENPDLVAKYGENRTSLSRKITRDLIGILERGLKDDENHLATFKNDHDHDSWRSRIRRVMFYDMQSEIDFSDAQLKEIQTIFLDHFTNSQARDKESLECLRKDPSLMMEYLLVSDATARSVGDPAEFAAMQKRIDDSLAGMDRLLWDMGIVTVFPGPLADPGFVSAFRGILEPNQLQAFDTYLEMKRGTFQRPPKAVELDQMNLAVNSIQKTLNAGDKMNEMIHGLMKDHGLPE